jgi:hypothetical protein
MHVPFYWALQSAVPHNCNANAGLTSKHWTALLQQDRCWPARPVELPSCMLHHAVAHCAVRRRPGQAVQRGHHASGKRPAGVELSI